MSNPLLELYLNKLKLTTIASQYSNIIDKNSKSDSITIFTKLFELEVQTREERAIERKLKGSNFPKVKTLDSFDFSKLPNLDKQKILDFGNCEFIEKAQNIIMLGNAGTGKTHLAVALGVAACQKNISVHFTSAAKLANDLMEARDELSLSRLHNKLAKHKLLIIDDNEELMNCVYDSFQEVSYKAKIFELNTFYHKPIFLSLKIIEIEPIIIWISYHPTLLEPFE